MWGWAKKHPLTVVLWKYPFHVLVEKEMGMISETDNTRQTGLTGFSAIKDNVWFTIARTTFCITEKQQVVSIKGTSSCLRHIQWSQNLVLVAVGVRTCSESLFTKCRSTSILVSELFSNIQLQPSPVAYYSDFSEHLSFDQPRLDFDGVGLKIIYRFKARAIPGVMALWNYNMPPILWRLIVARQD